MGLCNLRLSLQRRPTSFTIWVQLTTLREEKGEGVHKRKSTYSNLRRWCTKIECSNRSLPIHALLNHHDTKRYTHSDLFKPGNHMQIRNPKMNDTRKEGFTYISFTGHKRYSHADCKFLQYTNERQTILALSHQWLKEIRQNVIPFRGKGNLSWSCRAILEKSEKSRPENNYKNFLYSSGITEIFSSEVTPQLLPLSLEKDLIWA